MAIVFNEFGEPAHKPPDPWDGLSRSVPWQKIQIVGPAGAKHPLSTRARDDTAAERLAKRRAIIKFLAERRKRLTASAE